ncbi:MAG: hypothetical protein GY941_27000 [Planctomycetes bacterium]|nr:hypothetical protein [Planctomycetota bacterium]
MERVESGCLIVEENEFHEFFELLRFTSNAILAMETVDPCDMESVVRLGQRGSGFAVGENPTFGKEKKK